MPIVATPYTSAGALRKSRRQGRTSTSRITAAAEMRNQATMTGGRTSKSPTATAAPAYRLTPDAIITAGARRFIA